MKIPKVTYLKTPAILQTVKTFPHVGKIAVSKNNLTYLDIDDAYINTLFPLLAAYNVMKPDYFREGGVGSHITLIYPEERKQFPSSVLAQTHPFEVVEMMAAEIGLKTYYALSVKSPTLSKLRQAAGLAEKLCFKGYEIGFHITIGVKPNAE